MSARIPDGSLTVQSEETQLAAARSVARMKRMSEDAAALIKRVDEVERIVAALTVRLDALEALADVVLIDTPIPYELPEMA